MQIITKRIKFQTRKMTAGLWDRRLVLYTRQDHDTHAPILAEENEEQELNEQLLL